MKNPREKKKRSKPLLEPGVQEGGEKSPGLARALGSTDRDTREKGLVLLFNWLESHENISQKDLIRLWKALYFCFWHSDLVSVQTALADRLSGLLCDLSPAVAFSYFKGFVVTMKREWSGIDQHRMNKYLILVRKFYSASLERCKRSKWNLAIIRDYSTLLKDEVILLPTANDLSSGFAYYLCDVAVPEIEKFHDMPPTSDALVSLLDPFVHGLIHTRNKILLKKLYGDVFVPIVENIKAKSGVFTHLDGKTMAEQLFDIGSQPETKTSNRKYLYLVSSALEKSHLESQGPSIATSKQSKSLMPSAKENEKKPKRPAKSKDVSNHNDAVEIRKRKKLKGSRDDDDDGDAMASKIAEHKPQDGLRKSVRINLKKNLVRRIGEPPFPENVRTPPTSKPKGSALKQVNTTLQKPSRRQALVFDTPQSNTAAAKKASRKGKAKKTKAG